MQINWRRDYPVERIALGIIGKAGFTSTEAARLLLTQPFLNGPRKMANSLGRELNESTIVSRMKNHHEIDELVSENPRAHKRGQEIAAPLIKLLKRAGVE